MTTVIDYAGSEIQRAPDRRLGYVAATVAPMITAAIVYLSHDARMHMVLARGEWCGTPIVRAQSQLSCTGLLLLVSATALFTSWRVGVGVALCRASLVVAVVMWLFYVVSAFRLAV